MLSLAQPLEALKHATAVLLFLALPLAAQPLQFRVIQDHVVEARLRAVPTDNAARAAKLKELFTASGCAADALTTEAVKSSKLPNIICRLPGETEEIILVSAHFDKVHAGAGAIDNWSGASLLPSLFQGLAGAENRKHTFLFIGFTDEEKGLIGSKAWIKAHAKDLLPRVRALVNIDCVGTGGLNVWTSRSDPKLYAAAVQLSNALQLPIRAVNADKVGMTDSFPFKDKKVKTIDFHSLMQDTLGYLHTIDDQVSKMNIADYLATYKFLAAYLTLIDGRE
jgi:Zn-dependent M28 family amino/carboxypeptidase